MDIPLQISIRGVPQSKALEASIRRGVAKLQALHPRITSCRVSIEHVGHEGRKGHHYGVRVDVRLPGGLEAVSSLKHHDDMHVALRDALAATRQQLESSHALKS